MLFNSFVFWCFFAIVFLLYRFTSHQIQNRMLLVGSYIFYGCWDWRFLSLFLASTVIDFFVAKNIEETNAPESKKKWVWLSVVANLGFLGVFKYYDFFATELHELLARFSIDAPLPLVGIAVPVGISFYTFQTMSYTIDVYRGQTKAERDFFDFALFVCFFPQLVAGPVERSSRLLPQIKQPREVEPNAFAEGLYHIVIGLFKKVVVADNMASYVNTVFAEDTSLLTGPECWLGVYCFAFQIYCDFSGYSSLAQGIAKWLDFDLMFNFRMPYFSATPSEFWQRWHISLSQWLRDYLYISLGGNRNGGFMTYPNLIITMVLGGLWHGAGWTFLAWGLYHGVLLCVYRVSRLEKLLPQFANVVVMFHLVCIGWLFFRAESMAQVNGMLQLMFTNLEVTPTTQTGIGLLGLFVLPLMLYELWVEFRGELLAILDVPWPIRAGFYLGLIMATICLFPPVQHEFIYFQF